MSQPHFYPTFLIPAGRLFPCIFLRKIPPYFISLRFFRVSGLFSSTIPTVWQCSSSAQPPQVSRLFLLAHFRISHSLSQKGVLTPSARQPKPRVRSAVNPHNIFAGQPVKFANKVLCHLVFTVYIIRVFIEKLALLNRFLR